MEASLQHRKGEGGYWGRVTAMEASAAPKGGAPRPAPPPPPPSHAHDDLLDDARVARVGEALQCVHMGGERRGRPVGIRLINTDTPPRTGPRTRPPYSSGIWRPYRPSSRSPAVTCAKRGRLPRASTSSSPRNGARLGRDRVLLVDASGRDLGEELFYGINESLYRVRARLGKSRCPADSVALSYRERVLGIRRQRVGEREAV